MRNILKEAHKLTKEIKAEYPDVNYKAQLGICISYLASNANEITIDTVINAAEKYTNEYQNGWSATVTCNNWVKGSYNRTYIEIIEYRNGNHRSTKKCGYWDNNTNEYVAYDRSAKVLNLLEIA